MAEVGVGLGLKGHAAPPQLFTCHPALLARTLAPPSCLCSSSPVSWGACAPAGARLVNKGRLLLRSSPALLTGPLIFQGRLTPPLLPPLQPLGPA